MTNLATLKALACGDLANAKVASTPGGIEAQEKAGQGALVASTLMPINLDRTAFEALGFTFGDPVDEIFMQATLPAGWSRRASDHDMFSYIIDETGKDRVEVFYKAAFYDRRAKAYLIVENTP